MGHEPDNLVIEILRRMQADMSDLKEGQRTTNRRLAAIEAHMAGFHSSLATHSDDIDHLKDRIGRIERRLDIHDA